MNRGIGNDLDASRFLGIDVGSVSAGLAVLSAQRKILHTDYRFHHGNIAKTLEDMLESAGVSGCEPVAATHDTPEAGGAESGLF